MNSNEIPNHFTQIVFCFERRDLLCSHSNGDLFTCEDNIFFFTCEDIMFSRESSPGISFSIVESPTIDPVSPKILHKPWFWNAPGSTAFSQEHLKTITSKFGGHSKYIMRDSKIVNRPHPSSRTGPNSAISSLHRWTLFRNIFFFISALIPGPQPVWGKQSHLPQSFFFFSGDSNIFLKDKAPAANKFTNS